MNILIVDDSKLNIKIAFDALLEFNVLSNILTCLSGEEAIEIMENTKIDLVLLDIIMPGISGIDFLKIVSSNGFLESTKVIMLTTVDDLQVLKECFELGASDYIQKPFDKLEFAVRVKSVLSEIESNKKLLRALELLEIQNGELKRINQILRDSGLYH